MHIGDGNGGGSISRSTLSVHSVESSNNRSVSSRHISSEEEVEEKRWKTEGGGEGVGSDCDVYSKIVFCHCLSPPPPPLPPLLVIKNGHCIYQSQANNPTPSTHRPSHHLSRQVHNRPQGLKEYTGSYPRLYMRVDHVSRV